MQDQPLTNKTFMDFLEEFKKTNKLDTASNLLRTKYAREEVGEDNDKREKQLETLNESMLEVKKAIESLSKNFTKSNDQVVKKLTELQKTSAQYNPLSKIKDDRPVTLKEGLKAGVAGVKRFGSGVADLFTGKGRFAEARTPSGDLSAIGNKFKALGANVKDIVGTSKDYTVEGGRFAEAYTKSPRGGLMQGKKTGFDVGLTKFNEMQAKEEEIKKLEEEIKISTRQGFEAPKGKTKELEKLKAEFVELDPRKKIAPIEPKPEEVKEETAPIERKEVDSLIVDQYGTAFKREQTKEEAEQEKEQKSLIQTSGQPQPKSGLILPTGFQKEEDSSALQPKESFSEKLVKLTEKSLAELRKITKAITGAAASAPAPATGGGGGAGGGSGGGGGSMIGDAVSGAASAGIGGKIMGGLGAAAKAVGGGLLTAGKVVGGALLSKPALIAGGVALAGYGAYKGYQAIKGAFTGESKEEGTIEESTIESSEEGKFSEMDFAQKDPEGHKEYREYVNKKLGEEEDKIEKQIESGKLPRFMKNEKMRDAQREIQKEAQQKFKDKIEAAGALKDQKSSFKSTGPKGKESTGSSYGDAVNKRTEELLAKAPANVRDDVGYQNSKRRQAELEVEAGRTLKGKPLTPSEDPTEEPVAPKEKTIGQKIAGFFGFGDKEKTKETSKIQSFTDNQKIQSEAKERYQTAQQQEQEAEKKIKEFEEAAGPKDLAPRTPTESFLYDGENVGYKDTKKQAEYEKLKEARAAASEAKRKAGADYTGAEGVTKTFAFTGGQAPGESRVDSLRAGMQSDGKKLEALKKRGYTDEDLGRDDSLTQNYVKTSDGAKYPLSALGLYEKVVKQELEAPVEGKQTSLSPTTPTGSETGGAALAAAKKQPQPVAQTSVENAAMRDQMATEGGTTQPIVANNVQTNNQTTYMPMKADPRPQHRGSALDRYNDRIAAF